MASRCREVRQKSSNDLMMKNTGPPTQGPSLNSDSSYQPMYHSNGHYENMDNLKKSCHKYENVEFNVSDKGKTKDPESSLESLQQDTKIKGEFLPKESSSGHIDIKNSWITLYLCLIGIIAIVALLLNVLLLTGAIELKRDCNTKQESTKQCKENLQPKASITFLLKRIDMLEKNISSQINSTVHTMQGGGAGPPGPPGPQGPRGIPGTPGAGNLTQCQHQQKKTVGRSGANADFYVNFVEPKDKIVVGATCSSIRGDETYLLSATNSQGQKVYLCTCRGESNYGRASGLTNCLIDVWVCSKIS